MLKKIIITIRYILNRLIGGMKVDTGFLEFAEKIVTIFSKKNIKICNFESEIFNEELKKEIKKVKQEEPA